MKKLITSLCLLVLIGISANVMGQGGTAIRPSVGETWNYQVNYHPGNTYSWVLTTGTDYTTTNQIGSVTATTADSNSSTITITWVNPVVDQIYYLHVLETQATCTNRKVIAIQPKNNFKLDMVNIASDGNALSGGLATDNTTCSPAIANSIAWLGTGTVDDLTEATNFSYDYGKTTFYYKITATGINFTNTSWNPSITITKLNGTNATQTIETKLGGLITAGTWGNGPILVLGTNTPSIAAGAGNNVIWVKVEVSNRTGASSTVNENTSDNDFTFTLNSDSKDGKGNAAGITTSSVVQTQLARPNTGAITTP